MPGHTYTVAVTFTVKKALEPHFQDEQAVEGAFQEWLEGLGAMVHVVHVQPAGDED
jgi:hypothetical protein